MNRPFCKLTAKFKNILSFGFDFGLCMELVKFQGIGESSNRTNLSLIKGRYCSWQILAPRI